jgi:hypothetical protein
MFLTSYLKRYKSNYSLWHPSFTFAGITEYMVDNPNEFKFLEQSYQFSEWCCLAKRLNFIETSENNDASFFNRINCLNN